MAKVSNLRRPPAPSEYQEQCDVFAWAWANMKRYPQLEWLKGDLGGVRLSIGAAVKAKRNGCIKKGWPDIQLPVPMGGYTGLFIELKTEEGGASDEQRHHLAGLAQLGHFTCIAKTAHAAIRVLEAYLNGKMEALNG